MDYLVPTSWETPRFELGETVTPSPHHPIGAKGVGESATVGSPAAFVNAVIDAVAHLGISNIDMPVLPDRVWKAIQKRLSALVQHLVHILAMMDEMLDQAVGLRSRGEPFVLATVVWSSGTVIGQTGELGRSSCRGRTDARMAGRRLRGAHLDPGGPRRAVAKVGRVWWCWAPDHGLAGGQRDGSGDSAHGL